MTKKEREALALEKLREMSAFDDNFRTAENPFVVGVDEVGRGPLAGPVVTAAVVLPQDFDVPGVNDSKKLTDKKRRALSEIILDRALAVAFGIRDNEEIDRINILNATKQAMRDSINGVAQELYNSTGRYPDRVLIDAVKLDGLEFPQEDITKGDARSLSIAAASIVAKVYRDDLMIEYAKEYPGYSFESNKGYGTAAHYEGLRASGVTPIHRMSFLKNFL